jgi:putative ABC transport system permease protein
MSLTLILLVGSGLMIKSFIRLVGVDPGFNPNNVLRVDLSLPPLRYARPEQQAVFYEQLVERISVLPGVEAVGATSQTPLRGNGNWGSVSIEGRPAAVPGQESYAAVCGISADYFRVMKIPMQKGRSFTEFDVPPTPPAVIVNETMARQFWPDEDPLGQRLSISSGPLLTVVGVVGDVRHSGLNYEPNSEMFLPHTQMPQASMAVMVRTSNDPLPLAAAVRDQIKELDKDLPTPINTMDQMFSNSVAGQRFNALLLSIFGGLALGLAIVGIFGMINYSVAQRTHELGVRIALGAQRQDIFRLVIGQGLGLALLGVGIGIAGAVALTGLISDLLYDVSPTDPGTFVVVSLLLTAVALLACYLPARRATQVDPITALRCE